ncbi:MAG TPA: universal stress protein [Stellaceae bacterium]|nr:universal stress protein [Stellaceae bacterium]
MALKDILVIFDPAHGYATRLAVAAALAELHEAHLTGLCVIPPVSLAEAGLPLTGGAAESEALRRVRANLLAVANEATGRIEEALRHEASNRSLACEWRAPEGRPTELGPLHARYADLCVIGQNDPRHPDAATGGLVEAVMLSSGRPVVIVPYAGNFATVGRTILVAWNATREAARAVNDALPILERADKVTVLAVNPGTSGAEKPPVRTVPGIGGEGSWPAADIAHHLARHGVKAEASYTMSEDVDVGNTILSRAADLGADLIVMGGYGHSRLREFIMGGATRTLIESMTVPVLLSH